jgi:hypothetical protein
VQVEPALHEFGEVALEIPHPYELVKLVAVIRALVDKSRRACRSASLSGRSIAWNSEYWYSLMAAATVAMEIEVPST